MSGTVLSNNNAGTTIAGAITTSATSVGLASGTGALFPSPSGGNYFVATFNDAATGLLREIVHVTARSSDTCTIVRAQEGTTALNWSAGDLFLNLFTAGTFGALAQTTVITAAYEAAIAAAVNGINSPTNIAFYSSTQTITTPASRVEGWLVGGGGGGAPYVSTASPPSGGGGGGSGAVARFILSGLSFGSSNTLGITIGAAGAGGTSPTNGGSSVLNINGSPAITVNGGSGSPAGEGQAGNGGSSGGGLVYQLNSSCIIFQGQPGQYGGQYTGGLGGAAPMLGWSAGILNGVFYGGGGVGGQPQGTSGTSGTSAGGNGVGGLCILMW